MNAPATPAAVTQAAPADLEERILDAMRQATSKQPARADAIVAKVGGEPAAAWDAIARLIAQRRVGQCLITKAGQPSYDAVWPTGITARSAAWTGASHCGLYAKSPAPLHLPAAPDPTRDPRPDLGYATPSQKAAHAAAEAAKAAAAPKAEPKAAPNRPPKPTQEAAMTLNRQKQHERREKIARLIAGKPVEQAIPVADIAVQFGLSQGGARLICDDLADAGLAKRITVGTGNRRAAVVFDPRAASGSEGNAPGAELLAMRRSGELRQQVAYILAGVTEANARSSAEICAALSATGRKADHSSIEKVIATLHDEGIIGRTTRQRAPGGRGPTYIAGWFDPATAAKPQQAEAPAEPVATVPPAPAYHPDHVAFAAAVRAAAHGAGVELTSAQQFVIFEPDNAADDRFHFALFCSGELGIAVGERYLLLPPTATRRLAALLGTPAGGAAA